MKNIISYIYATLVSVALLLGSCTKSDEVVDLESGEGLLSLSYDMSGASRAISYDKILENSVLKIYKSTGELIRRYEPATDFSDDLYLVAGSYKATLLAGESVSATFSTDERLFYGESDFTIVAHQTNEVVVNCKMKNIVVNVEFDDTIAEKLNESIVYVSTSDEFSKSDAESNSTPTLEFTDDNVGYFMLPEGVNNISWGFYSSVTDLNNETTAVEKVGVIATPVGGSSYTLTFKYSNTPDGYLDLLVNVDDSTEDFDDEFAFSPQPTIEGVNVSMSGVNDYVSGELYLNVASIKELQTIEITAEGLGSFKPFDEGVSVDLSASGLTFVADEDKMSGKLTISDEFFEGYAYGGLKSVDIEVYDADLNKGSDDVELRVTGLVDDMTYDVWYNTAKFNACVTDPDAEGVVISYREAGMTDWTPLTTTIDAATGYYSASVAPTWISGKNGDGKIDIYNLEDGIIAGNTYEYKVSTSTEDIHSSSFNTGAIHTIPNGDMEGSLDCYTTGNTTTTTWGSGNNTFAQKLCTAEDFGGSQVAYLQSSETLSNLATGNLFYGQFNFSGTSGTVTFGQPFEWVSRPKAFKFKYAASLGTVDIEKVEGYIPLNDPNVGLVYLCIVDWGSRHSVKAGATGSPTGGWDPSTQSSTDEGEIIGYAAIDISEDSSSLVDVELPINYYDVDTKPSNSITLVISAAACKYGDYMVGSSSSTMRVDDFELIY